MMNQMEYIIHICSILDTRNEEIKHICRMFLLLSLHVCLVMPVFMVLMFLNTE